MKVWRVYCMGVEFGTDYFDLVAAQEAKDAYKGNHPRLKYYIRAVYL